MQLSLSHFLKKLKVKKYFPSILPPSAYKKQYGKEKSPSAFMLKGWEVSGSPYWKALELLRRI